ncbi:MAG: FAD-dependent 5-carboxymethylaminomethyl-2-thiouridine(34) oxidoreductase MnmC [Massilia sp.]
MDCRAHWRGRERFTIYAAGFDANALAQWHAQCVAEWRADPERPRHLHLIASADSPLPGFERQLQSDAAITFDRLYVPPQAALSQLRARIDGVCIAPGCTVDTRFATSLARLLARDAVLDAPSLDAQSVDALRATGWVFEEPDAARFATRKPISPAPPAPARSAIVIGAGLAGAAACERLCARGWQVTLVERHPAAAMEASGNLAGITMPLLSKDDNQASRLSRAAFLFARAYWAQLGGVGENIEGANCGVVLAARDAAHALLQRSIAAAQAMPTGYAQWFEPDAARARFGAVAPHGAWWFEQGSWIRPGSAIDAMLAACGERLTTRFGVGEVSLERSGDQWQVRGADGEVIARAPTVIVASGGGAVAQTASLPLDRVRGQVTHLASEAAPELAFVLCREAYLTPPAGGLHSMGATYDIDDDPAVRQSSQDENLSNLRSMLDNDTLANNAPLAGRVGFRAVAPDRLPMVGAVPDPGFDLGAERLRELPRQSGLFALLGYASRGLTWAPLAAELLAASLEGEPLPLPGELVDALDPGRFLLRERRTSRQRRS